jgi:hypothetical protein
MHKLIQCSTRQLNTIAKTSQTNINELNLIVEKLKKMSLKTKLKTNHFNPGTIVRMGQCSPVFLETLLNNLNHYGIQDKYVAKTLTLHEDWSKLSRENLSKAVALLRKISFLNADLFPILFSNDNSLLNMNEKQLSTRIDILKNFFTKNQLNKILVKCPMLLSYNLDGIRYKYYYVYIKMGIDQEEMSLTGLFNHSMDHIRQRHLFLERSGFYKLNNCNTNVINPRLYSILDSNIKEYLRVCTKDEFIQDDYNTFCDYLKEENFESEMLGHRLCKSFRNLIINNIEIKENNTETC